jgi:hypothetical protein
VLRIDLEEGQQGHALASVIAVLLSDSDKFPKPRELVQTGIRCAGRADESLVSCASDYSDSGMDALIRSAHLDGITSTGIDTANDQDISACGPVKTQPDSKGPSFYTTWKNEQRKKYGGDWMPVAVPAYPQSKLTVTISDTDPPSRTSLLPTPLPTAGLVRLHSFTGRDPSPVRDALIPKHLLVPFSSLLPPSSGRQALLRRCSARAPRLSIVPREHPPNMS